VRATSISRSALSSDAGFRRRAVRAGALLAALAMATAPRIVVAQGTVSGQLAVVERQGADHTDLRTAVVYLEPKGRSVQTPSGRPTPRDATIAMTSREFVPHVRVILAGGSVAFPNQDPFSHNVFSNAEAGPFDLGLYRRGASRSATFPRPGIYPIYCNIHSKMVSFVLAVPAPLVAVVGADGRFTLPDVPAGTYLLHAWHERAGARVTRELDVPPAGVAGQRVVLDTRAYVAGPHLNKFGLPYAATREDRY
jgi:plastocyanin